MSGSFESIVETILREAESHPDRAAFICLDRGESESERLSYADLVSRVEAASAGLVEAGLAGKPVMLSLPPGAAFLATFLGCMRVGSIAIPVPFPDSERSVNRLVSIFRNARPDAIVSDFDGTARLLKTLPDARLLGWDELAHNPTPLALPYPRARQPAFIQYTSGSTGAPKGIVVTHGNLIANQHMIRDAFDDPPGLICVSWLPHFHDMGLIGTTIQPLFMGGTAIAMSPKAFIQKPIRWLRAIEKYRVGIAGGPSFGYELCTRMISAEQASTLDLSSWEVAFCGAEPIRWPTLEKFVERFSAAKFRKTSLLPCYGLAEATLIASCSPAHMGVTQREFPVEGSQSSRYFVSCGPAVAGGAIALRGENGDISDGPDGRGEICVGGPHVSPGYWDGTDRTVTPFPDLVSHKSARFIPTGDIGIFAGGALYPVDRISDTIILYGAKTHAADVEATLLNSPHGADIRAAVAFATDDGQREKLNILCEMDRRSIDPEKLAALSEQISRLVAETYGAVPEVGFVLYGALPRTSSGKVQRNASRTIFLSGEIRLLKVAKNET